MSIIQTIDQQIAEALSSNTEYNDYRERWEYLFQSYLGGMEYKDGRYLTRYQLETDAEYRKLIDMAIKNTIFESLHNIKSIGIISGTTEQRIEQIKSYMGL